MGVSGVDICHGAAQCLSTLPISEGIRYHMSFIAGRISPSVPHGGRGRGSVQIFFPPCFPHSMDVGRVSGEGG